MFWLQQGPAHTSGYLVAGYLMICGVMALYLISLAIRRRNLQRDLEALKKIRQKDS